MHLSLEGEIGIGLALLGLAGMGAIMIAPDHTWIGWLLLSLAALGAVLLVLYHVGDRLPVRSPVVIVGMIVCGIGFISFVTVYFWSHPPPAQAVPTAILEATTPDVTLSFVYTKRPALRLHNLSSVTAKQIKWIVVLWNLDNPRVYSNIEDKSLHEALQIPISTFDFLRPHSSSGPLVSVRRHPGSFESVSGRRDNRLIPLDRL